MQVWAETKWMRTVLLSFLSIMAKHAYQYKVIHDYDQILLAGHFYIAFDLYIFMNYSISSKCLLIQHCVPVLCSE